MILLYRREKCVILASNGLALNHERSEWFKGGHKRPVLHIFRGGKVKSRGIVSFSVVCYFISLDPLFSHWFEFIWLKTSHPAKKPPPRQKNRHPARKTANPPQKSANLPKKPPTCQKTATYPKKYLTCCIQIFWKL